MSPEVQVRTWRLPAPVRAAWLLIAVVFVWLAAAPWWAPDRSAGPAEAVWVAAFLLLADLWAGLGLAPRITLTADAVVVRNLFRPRRVPLAEVVDVTPGYGGTEIRLRDGSTVRARMFSKSTLSTLLRYGTRNDRIAEAVRAAAAAVSGAAAER